MKKKRERGVAKLTKDRLRMITKDICSISRSLGIESNLDNTRKPTFSPNLNEHGSPFPIRSAIRKKIRRYYASLPSLLSEYMAHYI